MLSFKEYFCWLFLIAVIISLSGTFIKTFKYFYGGTATVKEVAKWYIVTLVIGLSTIAFCDLV